MRRTLGYFPKIGFISYILFIVYIIFVYFSFPIYFYQTDLVNFLTGAKMVRDGQAQYLYDESVQLVFQNEIVAPFEREVLLPFRNTPLAALLYTPFTYLNLKTATILVIFINTGLIFFFTKLFSRKIEKLSKIKRLWVLPIIFWPCVATLLTGQNVGIILLIIALIYFQLMGNNSLGSGIFLSLLLLRPQVMLILPFVFLLVGNKKKFLMGFIFSSLAIILINGIIVGPDTLLDYPKYVMSVENSFFEGRTPSISSIYFMLKELFPYVGKSVLSSVNFFFYLVTIAVFFLKRKKYKLAEAFIISVLATILFSIHVLSHDLILLLVPIYILISKTSNNLTGVFKNKIVLLLFFSPILNIIGVPIITTLVLTWVLIYLLVFNKNVEITS